MVDDRSGRTIGIAASGGGFRASLWTLGSLLSLEDAGVAGDVTTISSVSGGSITNGVVAATGDYGEENQSIRPRVRRLLELAADDGLVFFGPSTNGYVRTLLAVSGASVSALIAVLLVLVAALTALVAELVGADLFAEGFVSTGLAGLAVALGFLLLEWLVRRAGRSDRPTRAIVATMFVAGGAAFVAHLLGAGAVAPNQSGIPALLAVLAVFVLIGLTLFDRRSLHVERALADELFSDGGTPSRLSDLANRRATHVFCATELQSGIHAYFSPRWVYSYRFGHGSPADLTLARAVQSSASLPGAFAPRKIDVGPFGLRRVADTREPHAKPEDRMTLTDGGVYDNMGVSWFVGLWSRRRTWRSANVSTADLSDPGHLLVVNASAGWEWRAMNAAGVFDELNTLIRVQSVMYKTTTRPRRAHLIREWQLLDQCDLPGTRGTIVNIDKSPWELASQLAESPRWGSRASAAARALADLNSRGGPGPDRWRQIVADNATVPTVLSALGRPVAQQLLWHSYVLTAVASHIFMGVPLPERLPLPNELLDIDAPELELGPPSWSGRQVTR